MVQQEGIIRVRADGAERATRQLKSFGREGAAAINALPGPLGRVASGLNGPAGVGVAVGAAAAGMVVAVRASAQYETALVKLETQLGLSRDAVAGIRDEIDALGAGYRP